MLRSTHVIVNSLPDCGIFYLRSAHSERFKMEAQTWPFRKIGWLEAGSGVLEFDDKIIPIKEQIYVLIDGWLRFLWN